MPCYDWRRREHTGGELFGVRHKPSVSTLLCCDCLNASYRGEALRSKKEANLPYAEGFVVNSGESHKLLPIGCTDRGRESLGFLKTFRSYEKVRCTIFFRTLVVAIERHEAEDARAEKGGIVVGDRGTEGIAHANVDENAIMSPL